MVGVNILLNNIYLFSKGESIMNQEHIGKFIAKCRKEQNLTQEELAEKLQITYKAVSKWECGKNLPDASIMLNLCNILKISVNDLLSGEKVNNDNYVNNAEENLLALTRQIEKRKKILKKHSEITFIIRNYFIYLKYDF